MGRARNGEVTIFYRDEGEGEPILLIHGHTLDHRVFDDLAPALLAGGFRLIRPDLRGHGRSDVPPGGYRFADHAGDMTAVLDAAGVGRAAVVGFSLGGGVALMLTLAAPGRVGSLVLVDPVMPDRRFEPAFMDNLREVARVARSEGIRAAMAGPWAASPLLAPSFAKPGVREKVAAMVGDFPGAEYLATSRDREERDWTVPDRLGEIAVPTVVAVGENDLPGFRAFAEEAAGGIPGARLVVFPDCGHLVPLENPEGLAELIVAAVTPGQAGGPDAAGRR